MVNSREIDFAALLAKQEPLDPELEPYIRVSRSLKAPMIHSPLIIEVFYTPQMNAWINAAYHQKKELMAKAMREGNFQKALWLTERPYRIGTLASLVAAHGEEMADSDYWEMVSYAYIDSENLFENKRMLRRLLSSARPGREMMMTTDERATLDYLPDPLYVYRGHQGVNRTGMSWTLSLRVATWFATRYQRSGFITEGVVEKKRVIAFFGGRAEQEIVVYPLHVRQKKTTSCLPSSPRQYDALGEQR